FSGTVTDSAGTPRSGIVGVTFAFYRDQQGGAPLWLETQNVVADAQGRYSVSLGATKSTGLPQDLFASGEARWLGVQPESQPDQARPLLPSVPYALKAADAATVGGLPASAFVLPAPPAATTGASGIDASASAAHGESALPPAPCSAVTSDGKATANSVAKFT